MNETSPAEILILTDDDLGRSMAGRIEQRDVISVGDGYSALEALADREVSTILVPAPREELLPLGRAIRKLAPSSQLLALCRGEDRQEILKQTDGLFDGTCLYPPTRAELNARFLGRPPAETVTLSMEELQRLLNAAHKFENLEAALGEVVNRRIGPDAHWVDADMLPEGAEPLLGLSSNPPRVLYAPQPLGENDAVDEMLNELHTLLGSLKGLTRRVESLHRLAITDHLTGAYNRRYFYHLTDHVLRRAEDEGFRATLLLYDIDNFKHYNDQFGHAVGDEILRDTARMMKQITREQDIVARIGGDEFAVLFWDSELREVDSRPLKDVLDVANRFREAVEAHDFTSLGSGAKGSLTISGGLASFPQHGRTCLDLLRECDHALRAAKESGKNAIHLVGSG